MGKRYLGATVALALLAGCSSPPPQPPTKNVDHPAYGPAEYNKDMADCQAANTHTVQGGGYSEHKEVDQKGVTSCMASRGWR